MHDLPLFANLHAPPESVAPPSARSVPRKMVAIDSAPLAALRSALLTDNGKTTELALPPVSPAIYAELKPVIEMCGYMWKKRLKLHVGPASARSALEEILESGAYNDSKRALEFFATGPQLAAFLARELHDALLAEEPHLLEPSAGRGALIEATLKEIPNARITAVELDPLRAAALRERFANQPAVRIIESDIIDFDEREFDGVIANFPFDHAEAHLKHVTALCKPGASIVGVAMLTRRQDQGIASYLHDCDAWTDETPPDAFVDTAIRASIFGFRKGGSYRDQLVRALAPYPTIGSHEVKLLQEISRDLHWIFTERCNGTIDEDEAEELIERFRTRMNAMLGPAGIGIDLAWDPRAGHGVRLVLPSGETNDMGRRGMIVPGAFGPCAVRLRKPNPLAAAA